MDKAVLGPEELEHVRSSLRQVAGGAARLLTADPTEGSVAASVIRSSLNHDLPTPAQGSSGLLSARLSAQSAVECALAFVDLIVGGRRSVSLALPRVVAAEYVAYVFACVVTVADDTAKAFGFEGAIAERWQAARRRSWDEFVSFRELVD